MTYFPYLWCYDVLFDVSRLLRNDVLYDIPLSSWCIFPNFWCHDVLVDSTTYLLRLWHTLWLHDIGFDVITYFPYFLTSWRIFRRSDILFMSWHKFHIFNIKSTYWRHEYFLMSRRTFWCHDVLSILFYVRMYFFTSGRTFWHHDILYTMSQRTCTCHTHWCQDIFFNVT